MREYGVDIYDLYRDGSGLWPRRVLSLIEHLPDTSATSASMRGGPQYRGWGMDRYLSAAIFDGGQVNTWVLTAANSKNRPKRPTPWPRPEQARTKRVVRVSDLPGAQPSGGKPRGLSSKPLH